MAIDNRLPEEIKASSLFSSIVRWWPSDIQWTYLAPWHDDTNTLKRHTAAHYVLTGLLEKKVNLKVRDRLTELFLNLNMPVLRATDELIQTVFVDYPEAQFILTYESELHTLSITVRLPVYDELFLNYIEEKQNNYLEQALFVLTDLSPLET